MPELRNCPRCNKIFVPNLRDVCPDCFKKEEEDFQSVYTFVRKKENRMASIVEVEEKTGINRDLIYKFIKQGRISMSMFPNLGYPCESCGATIREGRICVKCKDNIKTGLDRADSEKRFQEQKKKQEHSKYTTYHSLKDRINKDK